MKTRVSDPGNKRGALCCAALLGMTAAGLAAAAPASAVLACRLAVFACLAPSVGCTAFALIHRIAGGQWTRGLDPYIRAGVRLLPWTWVVSAPVLLLCRRHYEPGFGYEGFAALAGRAVLFAALFFWLRWALSDGLGDEEEARRNRRPWAGPVGLILLFFMLTFLADDWLESLDDGWHSTAFAVVWIASQALCGLSLCILCGLRAGAGPESKGPAGRPLGLDWGNLLLASTMFWAYVTFAQFLIIWAGNMPVETSWYLRRERGAWAYVIPFVALVGFAMPFLLLLSRRLTRTVGGLAVVTCMLLAAQAAYLAWLIVPVEPGITPAGGAVAAAVLVVAVALFADRFVRAARILGGPP